MYMSLYYPTPSSLTRADMNRHRRHVYDIMHGRHVYVCRINTSYRSGKKRKKRFTYWPSFCPAVREPADSCAWPFGRVFCTARPRHGKRTDRDDIMIIIITTMPPWPWRQTDETVFREIVTSTTRAELSTLFMRIFFIFSLLINQDNKIRTGTLTKHNWYGAKMSVFMPVRTSEFFVRLQIGLLLVGTMQLSR